jgi:hypothetical protein
MFAFPLRGVSSNTRPVRLPTDPRGNQGDPHDRLDGAAAVTSLTCPGSHLSIFRPPQVTIAVVRLQP